MEVCDIFWYPSMFSAVLRAGHLAVHFGNHRLILHQIGKKEIYFLKKNLVYFIDYAIIGIPISSPLYPSSTLHPLTLQHSSTLVHVHGLYI